MTPQNLGCAVLLALVLLTELRHGYYRTKLEPRKQKSAKSAVSLVRRYLS
jgi:hypothetical protein